MSQEEVAGRLGVTTRSLTRWENGVCDPGCAKVAMLANLYEVSMDWIAGRTTIMRLLEVGKAVVRTSTIEVLRALVERGGHRTEVPRDVVRAPGLDVGFVIPAEFEIMTAEAARHVHDEAQRLFEKLRR